MEIIKRDVSMKNLVATVTVEISYYHIDQGSVRTIEDVQLWWYQEESERWYIDGDFPAFLQGLSN